MRQRPNNRSPLSPFRRIILVTLIFLIFLNKLLTKYSWTWFTLLRSLRIQYMAEFPFTLEKPTCTPQLRFIFKATCTCMLTQRQKLEMVKWHQVKWWDSLLTQYGEGSISVEMQVLTRFYMQWIVISIFF